MKKLMLSVWVDEEKKQWGVKRDGSRTVWYTKGESTLPDLLAILSRLEATALTPEAFLEAKGNLLEALRDELQVLLAAA